MAYNSLPASSQEKYSIEVEDVSMIFNMASEVLTNLKEYFIKAMKHELFFKEFRALNHVSFKVQPRRGRGPGGHQRLRQVHHAQGALPACSSPARAPSPSAATSPR